MSKLDHRSGVVRVYGMASEEAQGVFRDVLEDANDLKAKAHGVTFKPMGAAGSLLGRFLKAAKDRDVRDADLVVALLGQQIDPAWEADFDRARQHGKTVWLFAQTLADAQLANPDDRLRPVLDFRDRVEQAGFRYAVFTSDSGWQAQLRDHLFRWLDRLDHDALPAAADAGNLGERLEHIPAPFHASVQEAWAMAAAGRLIRARAGFAKLLDETAVPAVKLEYARFLSETGALERAEVLLKGVLEAGASPALERRIAAAYGGLGSRHEQQGVLDEAKRLYRASLHINERLNNQEGLAADYGSLGNVYWMLSELEKAEHAYRQALGINEALGREDGMAADYGNLGNVYGVWGRLAEAEQMYRTSLVISERRGRRESMANQYGNLGIVYRVQGRLDEAETMYREALAIHEALNREEDMAEAYNNLGNVHQERDQLDEAEAMYLKALAIDEAMGRKEGMANQYGNLGVVYQARDDYDGAEAMYRKSLAIFEALGDFMPIEQVKSWISDLEAQRRDHA